MADEPTRFQDILDKQTPEDWDRHVKDKGDVPPKEEPVKAGAKGFSLKLAFKAAGNGK